MKQAIFTQPGSFASFPALWPRVCFTPQKPTTDNLAWAIESNSQSMIQAFKWSLIHELRTYRLRVVRHQANVAFTILQSIARWRLGSVKTFE